MLSKLNEEERKIKIELDIGVKIQEINRKKGIKNIFEALIKKKVFFVGHNCTLDILFTISHFGDPLPPSLKEFKDLLKNYFSGVFDTKLIFENFYEMYKEELGLDFKNSHLETVYTGLKNKFGTENKILLHDNMKNIYGEGSAVYHEAAFDAYITGSAFVWMQEVMGDKIFNFQNKIYVMYSIYSCFNLDSDETYLVPGTMPYCLRAIKNLGDVDLKSLLDEKYFERIKKCFTVEGQTCLLILVSLEDGR